MLVDYGEVISFPQERRAVVEMADLVGVDGDAVVEMFWEHRPHYDRGITAAAYWSRVLGREVSDGDPLLVRLVAVDIASWFVLKPAMLDLLANARQKGLSLSLLSNAPHELADRISGHSAFGMFDYLLFSARLGLSKPDPAIYDAALARLAVPPGEVLFVDDRAENIAAAAGVGLRTFHYSSDDALADRLAEWATTPLGELRERVS
ncbi:MAG: putative hydrolase of the superfamily [Ilumatobacteraceae bacterium]